MFRRNLKIQSAILFFIIFTVIGFENCTGGFTTSSFDSQSNSASLSSTLFANANMATIGGDVVDESGAPFMFPGATISVLRRGDSDSMDWFGPSFLPFQQPFSNAVVQPGHLEIGITVPTGYVAQYAICDGPACAPKKFKALDYAGGVRIDIAAGKAKQFRFKMIQQGAVSSPDVNQKITCNFDGGGIPAVTDSETFRGTQVGVRIGINRDFGGIPVKVELLNLANEGSPLDIVDARSAAGASWQYSFGGTAVGDQRVIAFNQAAGNGYIQWGASGNYQGLRQQDWTPIWSDHELNHNYDSSDTSPITTIAHSPCYNVGYKTFDAQASSVANVAANGAIQLKMEYDMRAIDGVAYQRWEEEQAFYLSRSAAHNGNLRVYFVAKEPTSRWYINGGATIPAWSEGPLNLTEIATVQHNMFHAENSGGTLATSNAVYPINYIVFVYNVAGRDVAMAMSRDAVASQPFAGDFILDRNKGFWDCTDTNNYACGGLEWHPRLISYLDRTSLNVGPGQIHAVKTMYTFGTLQQLADLGFRVPGGPSSTGGTIPSTSPDPLPANPPAPNPQPAPTGEYPMATAKAGEWLTGWEPEKVLDSDANSCYSSYAHQPSDPGVTLSAWMPNGNQVGRIQLQARMVSGAPQAFPKRYSIAVTNPSNTGWDNIGTFTNQPDSNGIVNLTGFGIRQTNGIMMNAMELGVDGFGIHYFQICGVKLFPN